MVGGVVAGTAYLGRPHTPKAGPDAVRMASAAVAIVVSRPDSMFPELS
jgi:hypothetical protein